MGFVTCLHFQTRHFKLQASKHMLPQLLMSKRISKKHFMCFTYRLLVCVNCLATILFAVYFLLVSSCFILSCWEFYKVTLINCRAIVVCSKKDVFSVVLGKFLIWPISFSCLRIGTISLFDVFFCFNFWQKNTFHKRNLLSETGLPIPTWYASWRITCRFRFPGPNPFD